MERRIDWIDVSKGLGIILVIAGHTFSMRLCYPIYAFHMPLFFFLSGLVFSNKYLKISEILNKYSKSLLIPWARILAISILVCLLIPIWRSGISFRDVVMDLYTSNTNCFQNSSLWYLICYFVVIVLFYYTDKIKAILPKDFFHVLAGFISIALLWIRVPLSYLNLPEGRLPFKIDTAFVALVFFSIAFWNKDKVKKHIEKEFDVAFIVILALITAGLCVLNGVTNINSLVFGRIRLLYYPIAVLSIITLLLCARYLTKHSKNLCKIFTFYGKNSLLIFGFQSLLIRLYLLYFNERDGLSMILYSDNPLKHQVGSFLFVTFVASPAVVFLFTYLRKKHINYL